MEDGSPVVGDRLKTSEKFSLLGLFFFSKVVVQFLKFSISGLSGTIDQIVNLDQNIRLVSQNKGGYGLKVLLEALLGVGIQSFDFVFFLSTEFLKLKGVVIKSEALQFEAKRSELFDFFNDVLFLFDLIRSSGVFLKNKKGEKYGGVR